MESPPIDPGTALAIFGAGCALVAVWLWPRHGIVALWHRRSRRSERVETEDALKQLYHATAEGRPASIERLAGALEAPRERAFAVVSRLQGRGLARADGAGVALTDAGRAAALRILRAHRLVERYLADRTGVEPEDWHALAEEREHAMGRAETERLAARMGQPRYDPHGDPIPTADGELPPVADVPLSSLAPGQAGTITHLEDEPRGVYESLRAAGLALGTPIVLHGVSPTTLDVERNGEVVGLPRVLAPAVSVVRHEVRPTVRPRTLADLSPGASGRVVRLGASCRGAQRRRLLDLGVVPGTEIRSEFASAAGDPIAFRIRGALIALRRDQAAWIEIERGAS